MRYAVVLLLALSLTGCAGFVAVGGFTPGPLVVVSGTVTSVQISSVAGGGGSFIEVTFVSLQTNGLNRQFAFCGNNATQFPMNTSVTVHFDPGNDCNVIAVVITG